jgi:hypothetical protein
MKSSFYFAATCLVGFTNAGVYKLKLQKIPLTEQLVCLPFLVFDLIAPFHPDRNLDSLLLPAQFSFGKGLRSRCGEITH